MEDADILPHFTGTVVHDCWNPYWEFYNAAHQLCCVHLLRELNGVTENHPEQTEWGLNSYKLSNINRKKLPGKIDFQ